ncbi:hypothetical protein ACFE04_006186 [Oxalis oulophora]
MENSWHHHPIEIGRRISRAPSQFNSLFSVDYISDELENCNLKRGHYHPRANSNTFIEEQTLPWLDELLKDPDSPVMCPSQQHRRSISDSNFPCFDININQDSSASTLLEGSYKFSRAARIWHDGHHNFIVEASIPIIPTCVTQHSKSCHAPRPEAKLTKQQMAQRSRARKLQHIMELESTVQILQAERAQMSAQLRYLDQDFRNLRTENRALKQRLDIFSQGHFLKHLEQNMLKTELGRLQLLYNQQQNQNGYSRFRRSNTRLR